MKLTAYAVVQMVHSVNAKGEVMEAWAGKLSPEQEMDVLKKTNTQLLTSDCASCKS